MAVKRQSEREKREEEERRAAQETTTAAAGTSPAGDAAVPAATANAPRWIDLARAQNADDAQEATPDGMPEETPEAAPETEAPRIARTGVRGVTQELMRATRLTNEDIAAGRECLKRLRNNGDLIRHAMLAAKLGDELGAYTLMLTDEERREANRMYGDILFNGTRGVVYPGPGMERYDQVEGLRSLMESARWLQMDDGERIKAVADMAKTVKELVTVQTVRWVSD